MPHKILSLLLMTLLGVGTFFLLLSSMTQASLTSHASEEISSPNKTGGNFMFTGMTRQGEGAAYQTAYIRLHRDAHNNEASWIGYLRALAIDSFGNMRPLWDAHHQLSSLKNVTLQRNYSDPADRGRFIFTYLDLNGDGLVQDAEAMDFTSQNFGRGTYGILGVTDIASAAILVDYIRGDESQNISQQLRNRTLDLDGDGVTETMRLGDIIHSGAVEAGAPAEAFDLLYRDVSYGQFRSQYRERRRVVYVGANDGMLHAFNAGFYNAQSQSYRSQGQGSETRHPLGSELWAYVPYNLLPQLKQLQSPDYPHAWYVDGKPRIFDAKIFAPDSAHPGGWGTVLVIGMRLGGSQTQLNMKKDPDGLSAFTSTGTATTHLLQQSAYVLMDVTDPEQKPVLLAEITDPGGSMGYTIAQPAVATFSSTTGFISGQDNRWYLIFGSGPALAGAPQELTTTANNTAKLFVYDLIHRQFVRSGQAPFLYDLGSDAPDSFAGNPVAVDWDLNYKTDAVYFGTAGGAEHAPSGKLFKLDFRSSVSARAESPAHEGWTAPAVLTDPGNPVLTTPAVTKDEYNRHWILAGTGRFYSEADARSTQAQSLIGVIDALPAQVSDYRNLVETSKAVISDSGEIKNLPGATSLDALSTLARDRKGWKRTLAVTAGSPAERSINPPVLLGGIVFFTTFTPGASDSVGSGRSHLYCLDYKTGTARRSAGSCNAPSPLAGIHSATRDGVDLGPGMTAPLSLQIDSASNSGLLLLTQSSAGAVTRSSLRTSQTLRSGEIDWREIHP